VRFSHELTLSAVILPAMNETDSRAWLATPLGAALLEIEQCLLADVPAGVFGFELVRISVPAHARSTIA
jgi:hypothetical protein